jgi:hypothetical protein
MLALRVAVMTARPLQLPSLAGLGGAAHLVQAEALAWDRFERAVKDGSPSEIRAAREHLFGVSR